LARRSCQSYPKCLESKNFQVAIKIGNEKSYGGGWGWRRFGGGGFGDSTTTEQDYEVGTLVVDLYDTKTKQLIWRGSAEDTLSDKATKNEKNLDKGVAKMFKAFPPGSAKS
jgi:Domain of unknown function (DUF4136)